MVCRVCRVLQRCRPEEGTRPDARCFYCRTRTQSPVTVVDDDVNIGLLPRQCAGHPKCWFYATLDDPRKKCQMHATMDMLDHACAMRLAEQDAYLQIARLEERHAQFLEEKNKDKSDDEVAIVASDPEFGMGFALAPFAVPESY